MHYCKLCEDEITDRRSNALYCKACSESFTATRLLPHNEELDEIFWMGVNVFPRTMDRWKF